MEDAGSADTAAAAAAASAPGGAGNGGGDTPLFVYGTLMNDKVGPLLCLFSSNPRRSAQSYEATPTYPLPACAAHALYARAFLNDSAVHNSLGLMNFSVLCEPNICPARRFPVRHPHDIAGLLSFAAKHVSC